MGFTVDKPPKTSSYTVELFATVLGDRRIGDSTRMVLGGRDVLDAVFDMDLLYDDPTFKGWRICLQKFPRDLW